MNTILEETPAQTRMGVGFGPHRKGADAWKQSIGTKKVPARLEMLPEGESRLNRVGASAAVQIVLLSFFVALPVFFPERMNTLRNMAFIPLDNARGQEVVCDGQYLKAYAFVDGVFSGRSRRLQMTRDNLPN